MRWSRLLAPLGLLGVVALPAVARAQDPVPLYPENYQVLFENDRVRVVDFRLTKGATEKTHSHPTHVAGFLTDVKIRFTLPDGSVRLREAKAGETGFSDPTALASENIGPADANGILIELKTPPHPAPGRGGPVTAFTLIHGIPGQEEGLKQHLLSLAAPTRAEAGCIAYDLYQHSTKKHEFLRFEVWSSADALEAHKKAPHIRASFEKRQHEGWTTEIVLWDRVPE